MCIKEITGITACKGEVNLFCQGLTLPKGIKTINKSILVEVQMFNKQDVDGVSEMMAECSWQRPQTLITVIHISMF